MKVVHKVFNKYVYKETCVFTCELCVAELTHGATRLRVHANVKITKAVQNDSLASHHKTFCSSVVHLRSPFKAAAGT